MPFVAIKTDKRFLTLATEYCAYVWIIPDASLGHAAVEIARERDCSAFIIYVVLAWTGPSVAS